MLDLAPHPQQPAGNRSSAGPVQWDGPCFLPERVTDQRADPGLGGLAQHWPCHSRLPVPGGPGPASVQQSVGGTF